MFEQQIHSWRWTGNHTHEQLLYPALELHAQWAEDCFDADGNGLYHSYINTWPTDSVWWVIMQRCQIPYVWLSCLSNISCRYNGGESVEETAYMLRTHQALHEMAVKAKDSTAAAKHEAMVARIKSNFESLWISDRGHPAAWREESGHRRLRPDPWLYSIFLPIEAGLLTTEQAAQALFYTEWGLQREMIQCADGWTSCGERVWTSNWVPSHWSGEHICVCSTYRAQHKQYPHASTHACSAPDVAWG
jgi:hypothetical protein